METEEKIIKMLKKTEIFFKFNDPEKNNYDRMMKELREYEENLENRIKQKES